MEASAAELARQGLGEGNRLGILLTTDASGMSYLRAIPTVTIDAAYVDQIPGLGRPGVWFDGQARLHPLRYLSVLLDGIDGTVGDY